MPMPTNAPETPVPSPKNFAMLPLRSALLAACVSLSAATALAAPSAAGFTCTVTPNRAVEIAEGGRLRARFEFAHDTSSPARRLETYKPFLHVFDESGRTLITKGAGGEYTHHRGIFIGWMKITHQGKTLDRWTMQGGEQVVDGTPSCASDAGSATVTAQIIWHDESKRPLLTERRELIFRPGAAPVYSVIDITSELTAAQGDVVLDGDPEHAGVHFRAADKIDRTKVTYGFPGTAIDPRKARDLAWAGMTFSLDERVYTVVQIDHPANPRGTRASAYRDYARLGLFPAITLKAGERAVLRYRFVIATGPLPAAAALQDYANTFTGRADPVPALTIRPADQPAPRPARKS